MFLASGLKNERDDVCYNECMTVNSSDPAKNKNTAFENREDIIDFLELLLQPYISDRYLSYQKQLAWYSSKLSQFECFSRFLLGVTPYLKHRFDQDLFDKTLTRIDQYINPSSSSYLGTEQFTKSSQINVELFSLLFFLYTYREEASDYITGNSNIINDFFSKIFHYPFSKNWICFQIIANALLYRIGVREFDYDLSRKLNQQLDEIYVDEGYYLDGSQGVLDYYNHFGFFYYLTIYVRIMKDEDPETCDKYREHIRRFIPIYFSYFSDSGRNVPEGRSLIYRFGVLAFAGALVYLGEEIVDYAYLKDLIFRSLEEWKKQDIFNDKGFLSCGYYYENDNVLENYNSYGSPYWALKPFVILMGEDDRFWKQERSDFSVLRKNLTLPDAVIRTYEGEQYLFPVLKREGYRWSSYSDKYEKNVYSTLFGFNVSKGTQYDMVSFDSSFCITYDEQTYIPKSFITSEIISENIIKTYFRFHDIEITQYQLIQIPSILNIYLIRSESDFIMHEGSFPVADEQCLTRNIKDCLILDNRKQISAIRSVSEEGEAYICHSMPNTNVFYRKTVFPACRYRIHKGYSYHMTEVIGCGKLPDHETQISAKRADDHLIVDFGTIHFEIGIDEKYHSGPDLLHKIKSHLKKKT